MLRFFAALGIATLGIAGPAAAEPAAVEPRAVVELFTSQGCSSCPPADRLLGEFAADPSVVAISMAIDYWDYLGWRDTLARPRHTARQRGYAAVRGDRKVYTPQVVVNGLAHVVGSDRDAIEEAIARTKGQPSVLSVQIALKNGGDGLNLSIKPRSDQEAVGDVWLIALAGSVPIAIERGENKGRTVSYKNVALRWVNVGVWTGGEQHWTVPHGEFLTPETDRVAVLVQGGGADSPGAVLGAAILRLK